jgi:RimJ/RimL family protein N-acetyltransferase
VTRGHPVGEDAAVPADPDFATKPVLRGRLVALRPFRPDADVAVMAAILSDPEVRRLTGSVTTSEEAGQPQPLDDTLRRWYATRNEQQDRLDLAVEDAATGRLVGEVVLNEHDAEARTCNLRCLVGPEGRGRGLGTEALRLLLDHAFGALLLERVDLEVYAFNPRARHVYERLGFVVTATREDDLVFDGVGVAALEMELTAAAWRADARSGT